jgi:hypothetical protein
MNTLDAIREVLNDQGRVLVGARSEGRVVEANPVNQISFR